MAFPWLAGIGHYLSGVGMGIAHAAGAIFGASLKNVGAQSAEKVGERAGEKIWQALNPDREDIMKDLLRLGEGGVAIIRLLREANKKRGLIEVQDDGEKIVYREAWIINMLLKIEPRDRQWALALLNDVCERNRSEFFSLLNILHNNGYMQMVQKLGMLAKEYGWDPRRLVKPILDVARGVDAELTKSAQHLQESRKRVDARNSKIKERLEKKGVKSWFRI